MSEHVSFNVRISNQIANLIIMYSMSNLGSQYQLAIKKNHKFQSISSFSFNDLLRGFEDVNYKYMRKNRSVLKYNKQILATFFKSSFLAFGIARNVTTFVSHLSI